MKKVLALTLSAVLAMGAMTTAFAYEVTNNDIQIGGDDDNDWAWSVPGTDDKLDWDTEYEFVLGIGGIEDLAMIIDEDGDIIGAYDTANASDVDKSEAAAGQDNVPVTNEDDLYDLIDASKASLKIEVKDGKEYLEAAKIVEDSYEMKLQLTTIDSLSTKDGEISFEITLADRGSNSKFADKTTTIRKLKIGNTKANATDLGDSMRIKEDGTIIDTDDMDSTEDFEFIWGDDDLAKFVVDLDDNDGKKNLSYTTAPVDALIEANPEANMDFFTLKAAPRFNKIGEMTIYADGDVFKYIYEIDTDGQIKELNATYDEDEEGFVFTTRQLGSYVISDVELVGAAIDEEVPGESDTEVPGESDTTTDDGRDNPETGANDMVNVAAAMAVVSLAAAGAVAFKKSSK